MITFDAHFLKQKDGSFLVEFPDLPGCFTEGKSISESFQNAREALNGWLAARLDRDLPITVSKKQKRNHYPIAVDLEIAFTLQLRRMRSQKKMTQNQMAQLLGVTQQAYSKLENPSKANPTLSTIRKLGKILEKEPSLQFVG